MLYYLGLIAAGVGLSKLKFFAYNKKKYDVSVNLYKKSILNPEQQELVFTGSQQTSNLKKSHLTLLMKQFDPSKKLTKGLILRNHISHMYEKDVFNLQVNFTCVNLNDPVDNRKNDSTVVKLKQSLVLDKDINLAKYPFNVDDNHYILETIVS